MNYDVKDLGLAEAGKQRIEWAESSMPVLRQIRDRFADEKPLDGVRIAACLHVTTETANLMRTLNAGGAEVALCASNPLSTQDDVAASLVEDFDTATFAIHGEDNDTYYGHIADVLDTKPQVTIDDGADLVGVIHSERRELIDGIVGGMEETTTGVIRLRSMAADGVLAYPIYAVNDAMTKHMFDNRYGSGQSTLDGVLRATNALIAGMVVVVCGYGWCGRGVADRARGLGANVIVTEVDPLRGLEAVMDGFRVLPMSQAAREGNLFITVTGDISVLRGEHFEVMRDGALIANSGHFNVEIDIPALAEMATDIRTARPNVERYTLANGNRLHVLGEGRLINLAAAEGHPASVMDMSFAGQALSTEHMLKNAASLEAKVYDPPKEIDGHIAGLKLAALGIEIDTLTAEQSKYLSSWDMGTT
ncbi:adenosylhomocysteinase [Candidatus Poribacteria bacterium]|nr:adenosylhomocysteinase [Candidatus Poribacteria bacterium]